MKENFKKLFAVVLAVAMLAAQIVVPANAAADDYCSVCKKEAVRGEWLHTVAATCEDGFEIYKCAREILDEDDEPTGEYCTGTITVRIPATGDHTADGVVVPAVPHDCTTDGNFEYQTCAVCEDAYLVGGVWVDSYVDAAPGHDYQSVVTDPDCTNGGFTTWTCSVCEDSYTDSEVPCTGHDFSTLVPGQAATCKETGWEDYYVCSNPNCEEIDPERPYVELPVEDHGLHVEDTLAPTCTTAGYNVFKCEKASCPYYNGVTETLPKAGHKNVLVPAKAPTCTEAGWNKYYQCSVCDNLFSSKTSTTVRQFSYFAKEALGHTEVLVGFRAATCTEDGLTNAIVCDREGCGFVHHAGEVIPATGHTLTLVPEVLPECFEDGDIENGNIEHKHCSVCEKNFAPETEDMDIEAEPLKTVVTTTDHEFETMIIAPKCTEQGYTVKTCEKCYFTKSEAIAPAGHSFEELIEKEEPTCTETGVAAHNKCTACGLLFAADADAKDITIEAVAEADLVIDALGHSYIEVEAVKPTYTSAGTTAGEKCERCDEPNPENPAITLPQLQQAIKFHYELVGVNDADIAVNSGYVTLKIYFDVLADEVLDLEEYESDVLAEIFAIDFSVAFDKDAFVLTYVDYDVEDEKAPFANIAVTPFGGENDIANENGKVTLSVDTGADVAGKQFRGENNLLTVLTFQVKDETAAKEYAFDTEWLVTNPGETVVETSGDNTVAIEVKKLGDADGDGKFTNVDTKLISNFIANDVDGEMYIAEYDMNKDGYIDAADLNLIRRAIVGDEYYLELEVDPNAPVVPEV